MARPLRFGPDDAISLYAYNRAVFERFARRIRRLPGKQATRSRGIGHESLFATLVHVLNVHEVWVAYILAGRTSDPELEALFADATRKPTDWKGFDRYAKRVWSAVDDRLATETTRSLGRSVKVFWLSGNYTARDGLMQASFEQAHHVGELIGALWQDDIEPPEMTWIDTRRSLARRAGRR